MGAFLLPIFLLLLISCTVNKNIVVESESIFIPEPANKFAADKETEVETVKETPAHHIYDENFKVPAENTLTIGEKNFLTRINYIYNHIDEFANTVVTVEGMYGLYTSWDSTFKFPMVYRNGPGCCGDDQYGGFYLVNIDQTKFEIDDWIEVKGTPFMYEHTDSEGEVQKYLFLLVSDVKKLSLKERKAEMVNN